MLTTITHILGCTSRIPANRSIIKINNNTNNNSNDYYYGILPPCCWRAGHSCQVHSVHIQPLCVKPIAVAYTVCNKIIDGYTSAQQQYKEKNIVWAAMDSAALDHCSLSWIRGDAHNLTNNSSPLGTGSNNIMKPVATVWFDILALTLNTPVLVPKARTCKKFVEVQLSLVSVEELSTHSLTVLFDENTVTVKNKQGVLLLQAITIESVTYVWFQL